MPAEGLRDWKVCDKKIKLYELLPEYKRAALPSKPPFYVLILNKLCGRYKELRVYFMARKTPKN
jgi:hypothetical protein